MRVYLSHSIRGPKGKDATNTDMKENCDRAILVGEFIRGCIPDLDIYIPAEHENFVGLAYQLKYLTEEQILNVDCKIIDTCDIVIVFCPSDDSKVQGGRLVEYEHTVATGKPVYIFKAVADAVKYLTHFIIRQ